MDRHDEATAESLAISQCATHGFCPSGGCNPFDGNSTALVMPLCRPDRLKLVATGRKQFQAKTMLQLNETDKQVDRIGHAVWHGDGPDQGEDARLADVVRPCHTSLALTNAYFSFDQEWAEAQTKPRAANPINAVWLYMQWRGGNPSVTKQLVIEAANRYEARFRELCERFRRDNAPFDLKLDRYLRALSYEESGNGVWSLNCPRYHPEYRYDPNAGNEDALTAQRRGVDLRAATRDHDEEEQRWRFVASTAPNHGSSDSDAHTAYSDSLASSAVEGNDEHDQKITVDIQFPVRNVLGAEVSMEETKETHLNAPFAYMKSLPSKGVRDQLANAINLWAGLPKDTVGQIKELVGDLHTASLMYVTLAYVSDGRMISRTAPTRRGNPAAHSVFGVAQTINATSFAIVEALRKIYASLNIIPPANEIAFGDLQKQLRELYIKQSHDLRWTRHARCPTEEEYPDMVSKKTGGLYRLLSRLMGMAKCLKFDRWHGYQTHISHRRLVNQLGIYFQIRDDFKKLNCAEHTSQKGFCEDLEEGKFSFPLVHFLTTAPQPKAVQVCEVLEQ
ncbi:terpenoid synthase [Parathielavia appendiculata]|uniref:Terpenoid synthase n=1 Tax=Parathielavia appendiculata TaxID=2587402 RepID=A0AAN6U4J4_9PEZI|nr:terpenoid synthase [Parathielavia appendiculata]